MQNSRTLSVQERGVSEDGIAKKSTTPMIFIVFTFASTWRDCKLTKFLWDIMTQDQLSSSSWKN